MRKGIAAASMLALASALAVTGCATAAPNGSGAPAASTQAASAEPAKDAIKVDEIAWTVTSGVDNGDRRMLFEYQNNSQYEVVGVELEGVFKEEVTDKEIEEEFDYVFSDDTEVEDVREYTFRGEVGQRVKPGEKSKTDNVTLGMWYLKNESQYEMSSPDLLTILFVSDGKLYEEYYDYRSGAYSLSSDVVDTSQWSDSKLAEMLPQPTDELVVEISESDTRFSFQTIGTSADSLAKYADECKEAGFSYDLTSDEDYFRASTKDGAYRLDMTIFSDSHMTVYLDKKEKDAE